MYGRALGLISIMLVSQKRQFSNKSIYGPCTFGQLQIMREGVDKVKNKRELILDSKQASEQLKVASSDVTLLELQSKKRQRVTSNDEVTLSGSRFGFLRPNIPKSDFQKIREYVSIHGFGATTPPLTRDLAADIFRQHYYDKTVLMDFCRQIGISINGLKNEVNDRIDLYLRTKKITQITMSKKSGSADSEQGLRLDKIVVNYKSDPVTRAFFEKHIPGFTGFSAYVQKWLKGRLSNEETFTYADVIEEHKRFLKGKLKERVSGKERIVAHDSCQFNQFYIDYSHDSQEKPHSAKEAWFLVRDTAGDKTYARYKEKIQQITGQLDAKEQKNESSTAGSPHP